MHFFICAVSVHKLRSTKAVPECLHEVPCTGRAAPLASWVEVSILKAGRYYEFWLYTAGF